MAATKTPTGKKPFWKWLSVLGPGLTTGAADDDPSGIATYSQTGAQFGYGQLWTALWMLPLMTAVQEACARIGLVPSKGITTIVNHQYRGRPGRHGLGFAIIGPVAIHRVYTNVYRGNLNAGGYFQL